MHGERVGVVMGGVSAEREVSLNSGFAITEALRESGHDVVPIELSSMADAPWQLQHAELGVAFLALHGRYGEDGCIQGLLELLGVPYTGSSVLSSALAMDKLKSKELFRLHNVPTPPYYLLTREQASDLEECHGSFGFPVVVKPRREGSSVGVSKASSLGELSRGVEAALVYDDAVLVERYIKAREVTVGVFNGRALGAIEIVTSADLYDYTAKYQSEATQYFSPPRLPDARYRGVLNLAQRAAAALDCTGAVRVDVLVSEGQNEYVLEANTIPGMTKTSLLPKIAEAAGLSFRDLCELVLAGARLHGSAGRANDGQELEAQSIPDHLPHPSPYSSTLRPTARRPRPASRLTTH